MDRIDIYREALRETAIHGITRPLSCGTGDDGDGWFRKIAYDLMGIAARALQAAGSTNKGLPPMDRADALTEIAELVMKEILSCIELAGQHELNEASELIDAEHATGSIDDAEHALLTKAISDRRSKLVTHQVHIHGLDQTEWDG